MIYDSNYSIKLAQIAALGGDSSVKYDSEYSENLEILRLLQGGVGGAKIDDLDVSTGSVWSSSKTLSEIQSASSGDYLILEPGTEWTQAKKDTFDALVLKYGNRLQDHLFYKSNLTSNAYISCLQYTSSAAVFIEWRAADHWIFYTTFPVSSWSVGGTIQMGLRDSYPTSSDIYVRDYIDTSVADLQTQIDSKADSSDVYNKDYIDTSVADLQSQINTKQATLVSGTNIKTINNNSILGSGNIEISGGAGIISLTQAEYDALTTIDPTKIYNITDATPSVLDDYTPLNTYNNLVASLPTTYNPYNTTTAQSAGYLPIWNNRGQITGKGSYLYQSNGSINGSSETFYRTTSASLPNIYVPTTPGTSGQILQSRGSNQAPQWVNYRSDATDYIDYQDVSNGTYSSSISSFYQNCISLQKIGPLQMVRGIEHMVPVNGDPYDGNLAQGDKFCVEGGLTCIITYTDQSEVEHNVTIAADGTISDPDATGAISRDASTLITGYFVYDTLKTCKVTNGTAYEVDYEEKKSYSFYLPSSTRLYEGNVEIWFFSTEDGITWKNMHVTITNSTIGQVTTTGTFGSSDEDISNW